MLNASPTAIDFDVYQPRKPKASAYYRCVEDHFEQLETVWDERYQSRFGFWRAYVMDVIRRYLDCGDLHFGFARVKCEDCGHEYLLAFSCKRRHFCPSCHQKRVVEFGEWLCTEVLKYVPHRQWVFSIPKRLRIYFMMDRKLLAKLSQCAWKVLNLYLTQAVAYDDAKAGAVVAVQSFGDFQNFHPHLHVLATDGCFYNDDAFMVCPPPNTGNLEELFRHEVFKMLNYQPRNPKASAYYRCVEDHFEQLETVWDERYQRRFGFWRPYVMDVIHRYLDCGDLHFGFARVKCEGCGHEYLLAFSCKRRHFCPSCHQKRVVEFGEWLCTEVLKYVPHRQWVFSIPKRLRIYFMFDRKLLTKLSRCAWKVLNLYLTQAIPYDNAKAGAAIAVQSFGDFQNFHPHLHVLATDGCFYNDTAFMVCPPPDTGALEKLFRYEVLKMLKAEGKITDVIIENMMNWRHSGFNVYCGKAIWPHNEDGLENLARYIIRASFSQERMIYIAANYSSDGVSKVNYQSKDGTSTKTFDALDWLAQLVTHIPNKGEQMVRYYGYYSNKSRGLRKKAGTDDAVPALIESEVSSKEFRKNWARLIQKIYNVNPLLCPKCSGSMRIIAFIEDQQIVKKILKHLGLWDVKRKPPPRANSPPTESFIIYDEPSSPSTDDYIIDADYPIETYL